MKSIMDRDKMIKRLTKLLTVEKKYMEILNNFIECFINDIHICQQV